MIDDDEAVAQALTIKPGITAENYPVFLNMLEIENQWVIDALIGDLLELDRHAANRLRELSTNSKIQSQWTIA